MSNEYTYCIKNDDLNVLKGIFNRVIEYFYIWNADDKERMRLTLNTTMVKILP